MQTNHIRVAVVDDNDMIRYAMQIVLETVEGLDCVATGRDGTEAISLCRALQPDVVLIDLIMPGMNGVSAIRHIRHEFPTVRCVALTSYDEAELIHDALRAGAVSYLIKNMSLDELSDAIYAAYAGRTLIADEAVQVLKDSAHGSERRARLSPRELQVLQRIASGDSDADIAEALFVDAAAVRHHVQSILIKLRAANRVEAIAIALRDDLTTASV